ncbi:putative major facilitator superfamily domain-containing protein [Rosa chinensis]|uniref:Putative major facilitator superfamily domain-containing protein n=1 Tax=Rosa chinensis TaxID=74649 RepID=A0A2P6Q808_ROSCH|nr:putative major facilitator superfamily domain-containing protein [Rosa chinensis]
MLFLSCLMMSFTTLLTAFSTNIWIYSFLRFVTGFGRSTIQVLDKTSKDVWFSLYERYAKLSKFKTFELQTSMQKIQKGKDSIDKCMERFKTVRDQLSVSRVFIPDEDIVFLILNGLPVDFAAIKTIIRARTTPISLSELCTMLLDVESDIVQESRSFASAPVLEHKALPLSSRTAMIAQNILANSSQSMQYGIPSTGPSSQAIFLSHYTGYYSMTHALHSAASNVGFLPITNTNLIPGIPSYNHCNTSSCASNVHHYNAPPPNSTTHFGIPHNSMISSSILSMPNAPPNCQDLLPFTTNVGVPQSVTNCGYMRHNSVGNGNYFSSSAPSYGYGPQNGSSTSYVQQSNLNHNRAQQHDFSQQNVQPGTFNNSSQQNQQQNDGFSSKGKFSSQAMPCSASLFALRNAASVSSANKSSTPAQAALRNASTFREFLPSVKKRRWAFRRLSSVMGTGFGIGMVYYGMPLALGSLNLNLYLSVTLNALSELHAPLVAFFLIGKLNRRSSLLVFTFLSGACSILLVLKGFNPWAELQIRLEPVSFFSGCSALNVLLIFTIELFPTCVRNSALSMVRQALVLGGVFSPMLAAAGRANGGVLSYGVFGVVVGVCGLSVVCCLLFVVCLPETRGRGICDTMDESTNCNAVPLVV